MADIHFLGIFSIVFFYLLILGVGMWAARKSKGGSSDSEEVMLAGRNIGLLVGVFTMTGRYRARLTSAGPRLRNGLPPHLRQCDSLGQFKWLLKTHLFGS